MNFIEKWSGDIVIAFCAAWGAALSTIHALCALLRHLRNRPKIHVFASLGYNGTKHWLSLCVNNKRGCPVTVQSWGVDVRKGSGPVVLEVTGLPAEIQPYHYIHITNDLSLFARQQVLGIYVVTHGTKKWRVSKKNFRSLLSAIKSLDEK